MFDFHKLEVYRKSLDFNAGILALIKNTSIDKSIRDQLKRAALSISLNIAEGTSRFTKPDRRNFYVISRGSVYECVAILDHMLKVKALEEKQYNSLVSLLEEISKMLYTLIERLGTSKVKY